jgi:hypothetical protein
LDPPLLDHIQTTATAGGRLLLIACGMLPRFLVQILRLHSKLIHTYKKGQLGFGEIHTSLELQLHGCCWLIWSRLAI